MRGLPFLASHLSPAVSFKVNVFPYIAKCSRDSIKITHGGYAPDSDGKNRLGRDTSFSKCFLCLLGTSLWFCCPVRALARFCRGMFPPIETRRSTNYIFFMNSCVSLCVIFFHSEMITLS